MPRSPRLTLAIALAAVILLPVAVFAFDRATKAGEVQRNVFAADIDLSGLSRDDALEAVRGREAALRDTPAVFIVDDEQFALDPAAVGLDIDEDAVVDAAIAKRREGGIFAQLGAWWRSFRTPEVVELPVHVDEDAVAAVLTDWGLQAIDNLAHEGGVVIQGTRALPDYPRAGEAVDLDRAIPLVIETLRSPERIPQQIPLRVAQPELTKEDIDAAVEEAALILSAPVTLAAEDPAVEIVFTPEDLALLLEPRVERNSPPQIVLDINRDILTSFLIPLRDEVEQPARDASFDVDLETDTVTIVPSRPATKLDVELVAEALRTGATRDPDRVVDFPLVYTEPAEFTTEDAEAMGPLGLVSEFTTNHPAGQPRVINIHLMADEVDGAIIWPDEVFSLNEYVGERTTEEGYVPAPMILRGELVDSVGGGVSQFATTFYNAVFYGCYEDVEHKPHSYYFSRYPEVNEATISWPVPDLKFRNDSDAVIIVRTQYTSTSITVKFFGNNGGRVCERRLGSRHAFTEPPVEYEPDASLSPTEEVVVQAGWEGWTNSVVRVMTHPDGSVTEQTWVWTYQPGPRIVRVHPCNVPDADEDCPIEVPSVVGMTFDDAAAALTAAGFVVEQGESVAVADESQHGLVVAQSPAGGEFLPEGTTVTVAIGVYVPPEDEGGES